MIGRIATTEWLPGLCLCVAINKIYQILVYVLHRPWTCTRAFIDTYAPSTPLSLISSLERLLLLSKDNCLTGRAMGHGVGRRGYNQGRNGERRRPNRGGRGQSTGPFYPSSRQGRSKTCKCCQFHLFVKLHIVVSSQDMKGNRHHMLLSNQGVGLLVGISIEQETWDAW